MRRIVAAAACLALAGPARAQVVVDLEDVALPPAGYANSAPFASRGAGFNNSYDPGFGTWGGFAASNRGDTATPGFGNQYSSFAGGGDASARFAVGFVDTFTPTTPTVTLPAGTRPLSARVTNTTYAALSMRDGDPFAKKFGGLSGNDPDWFLLTVTGRDAQNAVTGSLGFYLADYRFADNSLDYIVAPWTAV